MTPKGNNIKIKPVPNEKIVRGILYPDTLTPSAQEWGEITQGKGRYKTGSRVLYFGKKCIEKDGEKIVATNKILYWV